MSSVAIQGNAAGAGVFTLAAPNSPSSYTLTLPTNTGTLVAPASVGTVGQVLLSNGAGVAPSFGTLSTGKTLIQVQSLQTGAFASGTTQMVWNNSPPQITGGTQFMSLAITPTSATSILEIRWQAFCNHSGPNYIVGGIFQDSTANAITGGVVYMDGADAQRSFIGQYRMTAGTTSATTFTLRFGNGNAGGTHYFNGCGGAGLGGTYNSYLVIYEYAP
jgi:hypothetical protein